MRLLLAIAALVAACGGTTTSPAATSAPTASVEAAPQSPSQPHEADQFAGLPYTMKLPEGWFGGGQDTFTEALLAFESANPELTRIVKEMSPPVGDVFVGISPDGGTSVSVNTLAAGAGWSSDAAILDESERQNLEGIDNLPTTIGKPEADRVTLPVGEAVRIRWTSNVAGPQDGSVVERPSVGYAITDGFTIYVVVFTYDDSADRTTEIEHIMETFKIRP